MGLKHYDSRKSLSLLRLLTTAIQSLAATSLILSLGTPKSLATSSMVLLLPSSNLKRNSKTRASDHSKYPENLHFLS